MTARLATIALSLALLAAPAQAAARAPAGFVGISPQSVPSDSDFELMAEADVASVRLPLPWSQIEPFSPRSKDPTGPRSTAAVELAAITGSASSPSSGGRRPGCPNRPGSNR